MCEECVRGEGCEECVRIVRSVRSVSVWCVCERSMGVGNV